METSIFLTAAELAELTGRKLAGLQRRWLSENKYRFDMNANGRPMVARGYVLARLGAAPVEAGAALLPGRPRPNFSSLIKTA